MSVGVSQHRVRAVNPSADSENRIHADDVARRYGFRGGLVPGVTLWAYMTNPVVASFGRDFLERGWMRARFNRPVYEGEHITCSMDDDGRLALENEAAVVCATGEAGVDAPPDLPVDVDQAPLPDQRRPADTESLSAGTVLGSLAATFRAERAGEFLHMLGEPLALYRDHGVAHPGWLVWFANTVLVRNVVLGPWIHVESTMRQHAMVTDGDVIVTRARVAQNFERKGHRFVDLDIVQTVADRPVTSIAHRAIYELRPPV